MSTSISNIEVVNSGSYHLRLGIRTAIVVVFFAFIGFFFIEAGVDYENYTQFLDQVREYDFYDIFSNRFEPLFGVLAFFLVRLFADDFSVYFSLLVLAISLKAKIISSSRQTGMMFIFLVGFYLFRFFPLFELTQIRVSLAVGFVMLAFQLHDSRFKWILFLLACTTHYSVIVLLPLLFFVNAAQTHSSKYIAHERAIWLTMLVCSTIAGLMFNRILQYITPYLTVLQIYDVQSFGEVSLSPFNATAVLDVAGITSAFALRSRMSVSTRYWLYIQVLGVLSFYLLIEYPIMAFRIKDLFCVFWIFYIRDALEYQGLVKLHALFFIVCCMVAYFYFYFIGKSAIFPINM